MSFRDVPRQELIERTAAALKSVQAISSPAWATFAKTGMAKDHPPTRPDWWHVRTASVLAKLANHSPVGVQKLRTWYGSKKNRGVKPEHFYKASGNILRKILQQLEKAGFAKKVEKGLHKGRAITPQGVSFLDKVSTDIMKDLKIVIPKKPEGELRIVEEKKVKKPAARKRASPRKRAPKKKTEGETGAPIAPAAQPAEVQAEPQARAPEESTAPPELPKPKTE